MKKILITGKNSYIGNSFEKWLAKYPNDYSVEQLDMHGDKWKEYNFSQYDVVFHVAGIAHVSSNPSKDEEALYYRVNTDLAIETAKKAKSEGVSQFIFMSSIIVYGDVKETKGRITKDTVPKPKNAYGDSKLQAEKGLNKLRDENFKVVILRPPMIYGPGSKGNFPKLVKFAKITPIFPNIKNKRSMLYIENLCSFIQMTIDEKKDGTFFPQNKEYVCTSEMVKEISEQSGKKLWLTKIFNPLVYLFKPTVLYSKVFGDLYYDMKMRKTDIGIFTSLRESIGKSFPNN